MKLENSEADGEGDCQHLASSDISQVRRSFKLQWVILYCPTAGHHQEKYPYIFGPSGWVLLPNSARPRDRRDTVYQHVSQVCKRCPVHTEFHLHSSLQKEIWNFILLVSYNSRSCYTTCYHQDNCWCKTTHGKYTNTPTTQQTLDTAYFELVSEL